MCMEQSVVSMFVLIPVHLSFSLRCILRRRKKNRFNSVRMVQQASCVAQNIHRINLHLNETKYLSYTEPRNKVKREEKCVSTVVNFVIFIVRHSFYLAGCLFLLICYLLHVTWDVPRIRSFACKYISFQSNLNHIWIVFLVIVAIVSWDGIWYNAMRLYISNPCEFYMARRTKMPSLHFAGF